MTVFEIVFNVVAGSVALASLLFLRHILNTFGRDPINDPELVEKFCREAPCERLKEVMSPAEDSQPPTG